MKLFYTPIILIASLGLSVPLTATPLWGQLAHVLQQQVGIRYRFGGTNPDTGFDCSGLVNYAYSTIGKKLPRSTKALQHAGTKVPLNQLRHGDLIFFSQKGRISHVGIYMGHGVVIHAPSTGKNVTVMEVFNHIYWKNTIAFARRVLPNL